MNIYMVESYDFNVTFDKNIDIIALNPEVCHQLDKKGIKYLSIEKYYDKEKMSKCENKYFKSQLSWFNEFDNFLQDNIPELKEFNLKMGTLFYLRLKTLIDNLVIKSYVINNIVSSINPSKIIFFTHPFKKLSLDCRLIDKSRQSLFSYIIPIICKEKNIHLDIFYTEKKDIKNIQNMHKNVKQKLAKYRIVRNAYFFLKYGKESFSSKNGQLNIFLSKDAYNGIDIIKSCLKNGHNIYTLFNNKIIKYSPFGFKKYCDIKIEKRKWDISLLENDKLIDWINKECQLNISDIILPRLQYFISEICPIIFGYFKFFVDFYKTERIDFIIGANKAKPIYDGLLASSYYNDNTKSVCVLHGDHIYENDFQVIDELGMYDIHISSNIETKEYVEFQCKNNNLSTQCYCSNHRVIPIIKINRQRELQKKYKLNKKQKVVYLPTLLVGDCCRMDGQYHSDIWYYNFQKSLIEYFSTKNTYDFIWKGLPISDWLYNPIPDIIKNRHFDNIEIATEKFDNYLLMANKVICDFGSTGFFESVFAGVPTIALYYSKLYVPRNTALKYFGNLLQSYSNMEEAIEKIDLFLDSDPNLYKKDIDTNYMSVIDILEDFKNRVSDNKK